MSNLLSFTTVITYCGYIMVAILVLLLMVLIHELGHYVAGKILKFKINEFSVGFGPKIFQKTKKNGEVISLRAFPLGGYCAFEGENEDGTESPEAFNNQKPWKRLIVLFSGAFFNFLSAIIFSFMLLMFNGYDLVEIKKVDQTSINYHCLQQGDIIHGIEGQEIDFVSDDTFNLLVTKQVQLKYSEFSGELTDLNSFETEGKNYYYSLESITYNITRNNEKTSVEGFINVIYDENGDYAGWTLLSTNEQNSDEFNIGNYKYSFGESLLNAVPFTFELSWKILIIFGDLFTGKLGLTALSGPITTIDIIATGVQQNASLVWVLLPLIAVNLAIFNLLPIPALDGFQMLFVGIEWIRKKPVKREVLNLINNIGLFLLLGLVLLVDGIQIFMKIF